MTPAEQYRPAETSFVGDTVAESRKRFRKFVLTMDQLVESNRVQDARNQLPKVEALGKELHRLLNPRDAHDQRTLNTIDKELVRLRRSVREGWGGKVGTGALALVLGGVLGVGALLGALWMYVS